MKTRFLAFVLLFCAAAPAMAADDDSANYYVPPAQFNATMQVMDGGYANLTALLPNATASFTFDGTAKTIWRLRIALDATNIVAGNTQNARDLALMLDNMQFNEIRVVAPDTVAFTDNKAEIKANVTLHGATKPVTFAAVLNRFGKSAASESMWSGSGYAVGLSLTGTLKRADFGLTDNPELPARFGDTLMLSLEMQALRQ